jgi:bla regulator protein BlaR1
MIPAHWTSALANHLWQSTVFAAVAWLLTLALRKNQARTRYWLWLIASVKFLIPFSLLTAIGSHLSWTTAASIGQPAVSVVMEQITQPFPAIQPDAISVASIAAHNPGVLSIVLLTVWSCGFLALAFSWWRRWRQVRTAVRASSPLHIAADVPVLSSRSRLEPGIFGVFRPVLLLPEGITDRLTPLQLTAIVAHELCHVRRRDNLAAVIHMAVETVFWFHPQVWWIGSRLVEERERACDEEVLRLGSEPAVYAESILKTCQFYLESPLACVSGITGSDLKQRMVRIMTHRLVDQLSFGRKLLLACAGMVVIAGPVVFGFANGSQSATQSQPVSGGPLPSFEVASVKPNHSGTQMVRIMNSPGRFSAVNVTPKMLIQFAYDVKGPQLSGSPSWIDSERYDIDAKTDETPDDVRKEARGAFNERRRLMVQSLLVDRFKLTLTHETKDLPVYALMVAKSGPKFHETTLPPPDPNAAPEPPGPPKPGQPLLSRVGIMMGRGQLNMNGAPMSAFANALSDQVGRKVLDKTGLQGNYDLALQWTPDEGQGRMFGGPGGGPDGRPAADSPPPPDASGPTLFTALQEQLGLKLESEKGPVETLVIAHIERPSEN